MNTSCQWHQFEVCGCKVWHRLLNVLSIKVTKSKWEASERLQQGYLRYQTTLNLLSAPQNGQTYSNNSLATAGELFECVWPFCGVGSKRVKNCINQYSSVWFLLAFSVSNGLSDQFPVWDKQFKVIDEQSRKNQKSFKWWFIYKVEFIKSKSDWNANIYIYIYI